MKLFDKLPQIIIIIPAVIIIIIILTIILYYTYTWYYFVFWEGFMQYEEDVENISLNKLKGSKYIV